MTKLDLALRLARESGRSAAEAADLLDEAVQKILTTSAQAARGPLCAVNKSTQAARGPLCAVNKSTQAARGPLCAVNKSPQAPRGPLCEVNKTPQAVRAPSRAIGKTARASSRGAKPKGNSPDLAPQSESAARELGGGRWRGRLGRRSFSAGGPAASNKSPAGAAKRPEGRPAKKAAKLDGS